MRSAAPVDRVDLAAAAAAAVVAAAVGTAAAAAAAVGTAAVAAAPSAAAAPVAMAAVCCQLLPQLLGHFAALWPRWSSGNMLLNRWAAGTQSSSSSPQIWC